MNLYVHTHLLGITERREYLIYLYIQTMPSKTVALFLLNEILANQCEYGIGQFSLWFIIQYNFGYKWPKFNCERLRSVWACLWSLLLLFYPVLFVAWRNELILNYIIFSYVYNPLHFAISIFNFVHLQDR